MLKIKVAVVDDQRSNRLVIEKILAGHYVVSLFESADDIFNAYESGSRWAIVLSDLHMKGKSGRDVVKYFSNKSIPVMILTADSERAVESELLSCGAIDFVTKPVHPEILLNRISIQLRLSDQLDRIESAQNQLIQSEKLAALGQLAAGVAHEINNPIGFISSNMNLVSRYIEKINEEFEALKSHCEADPTGAGTLLIATWSARSHLDEYLTNLNDLTLESKEGLGRVRDIVKDLKEYSHTGELIFEPADINHMLKSSVNLLRNEIKYKADVVFEFESNTTVECIHTQLGQVFVNIIVNACHAIDSFGKITIKTEVADKLFIISISDTGKGMSQQVLRKIFDPFYTTKAVGKGTGIGLAITRSIIDRHNGRIEVSSIEGVGSTFTVSIPVEQPKPREPIINSGVS
ncbi:MAG: two-component system NtrC family sensor kinase [Reinekea sp.]